MPMQDLAAVILAGGASRRMGQNKALLRLRPDGPRLIEQELAAVTPLTSQIVVSTNTPDDYAWLRLPLIPDRQPGCGPLGGLEAALATLDVRHVLLLGCDMPWVATGLLRYLISLREQAAAIVPRTHEGLFEPLCAVYSQTCLPVLQAYLASGRYQMRGWLAAVSVRAVTAEELTPYDPTLRSFKNYNTPADLAET